MLGRSPALHSKRGDSFHEEHYGRRAGFSVFGDLLIGGGISPFVEGAFVGEREKDHLFAIPFSFDDDGVFVGSENASSIKVHHAHETRLIAVVGGAIRDR